MKLIYSAVLLLLLLTSSQMAQVRSDCFVFLKSWSQANEIANPEKFLVKVGSVNPKFREDVSSKSGKIYRLEIVKNPMKDIRAEHWKLEFRELFQNERVGADLIYGDKPGDIGRDYFPREDLAGFFYPNETKKTIINGIPLMEGIAFYPVCATRKILVDSFLIIVTCNQVGFDGLDKPGSKTFELNIEVSNP